MGACQQCGQPALCLVGPEQVPLCLNCYERFDKIIQRQQEENAAMLNYLHGQMETAVGLPPGSLGPRIQIPRSQIINQPMTLNNIHVKDSAVGARSALPSPGSTEIELTGSLESVLEATCKYNPENLSLCPQAK